MLLDLQGWTPFYERANELDPLIHTHSNNIVSYLNTLNRMCKVFLQKTFLLYGNTFILYTHVEFYIFFNIRNIHILNFPINTKQFKIKTPSKFFILCASDILLNKTCGFIQVEEEKNEKRENFGRDGRNQSKVTEFLRFYHIRQRIRDYSVN